MRPTRLERLADDPGGRVIRRTEFFADDVGALLSAEESGAVRVGTCRRDEVSKFASSHVAENVPRLSGQRERLKWYKGQLRRWSGLRTKSLLGDLEVARSEDVELRSQRASASLLALLVLAEAYLAVENTSFPARLHRAGSERMPGL